MKVEILDKRTENAGVLEGNGQEEQGRSVFRNLEIGDKSYNTSPREEERGGKNKKEDERKK